jgi:MYXO-CTERM domain-containing protein
VQVQATDNTRVTRASIFVDGVPSGSSSTAPWNVKAPTTMARGQRTIKIEVTDGRNTRSAEIKVNVEGGAAEEPDDDLAGGCSIDGGGGGGGGGLLLGLLALLRLRRR